MDYIFQLDRITCGILRKLHVPSSFISRKNVIQRYVVRSFSSLVKDFTNEGNYINYKSNGQDTIWIFWWQGEEQMPPLVKSCYRQIQLMSNGCKVQLLHKDNYEQFADIPQYIKDKLKNKQITITHFSDILRFTLLLKYGGWWMDATIYPTCPLPSIKGPYTVKLNQNDKYISLALWSSFLWHLPAGHPVAGCLVACWHKYWNENEKLVEYFLTDHILRLLYDISLPFKNTINKLPLENNDLYFFQGETSRQPFDTDKWLQLKTNNRFFKLNWRTDISEYNDDSFLVRAILKQAT